MKVVINACYGGFGLSPGAKEYLRKLGTEDNIYEIKRNHPALVKVVEELGEKANTPCSKLKIVEIPDEIDWVIEEYDGIEHVAEAHRTWR